MRGGIAADGWIVDGCLFTNYRYAFALLTKRNVLFIPPLGKGLHRVDLLRWGVLGFFRGFAEFLSSFGNAKEGI